jgi:hypothetical protein
MPNQSWTLDFRQNDPPAVSVVHQDEPQYEKRRVSIPWSETNSAIDVISDERVLSSFYRSPQPYKLKSDGLS